MRKATQTKTGEKSSKRKYAPKYVLFFSLVVIILLISAAFLVYVLQTDKSELRQAASNVFLPILLLSLLFALADSVKDRIVTIRSTKRILEATNKIKSGDLSARIRPVHKRAKNEFDVIIENFNIMADELSSIEQLRNDFISNVSHEFKTPLSVIGNYAEMLKSEDVTDKEREEYACEISNASRKLSNLTTNILKLNKLENSNLKPAKKCFDLSEKLCDCIVDFESVWSGKNVELECDINEKIQIESDEELLSLVWHNLISNAVKFTPQNGNVFVSAHEENGVVTVSVTDSGCGMDEKTAKRIFEKFYQGDTSHSSEGNGLGLALVKTVLELLGGEITVETKPNEGSTFTVRLNK